MTNSAAAHAATTAPEYLTIPEAAAQLRIAVPTLRTWIAQGTINSVRPGRRHLIAQADVDRLLRPAR